MDQSDQDPQAAALKEHYRFLLLPLGAPLAEVKEVHRAFLKAWHPDRHQGEGPEFKRIANRVLQRATEAMRAIEKNEVTAGPMIRCESWAFCDSGSHVCVACGKAFLTDCPQCNHRWPALFRYCGDCGARL